METQFLQRTSMQKVLTLDPRTKLYLLLILNIVIINGKNSGVAIYIKPILAAVPFFLLLKSRRKSIAWIYVGIYTMALLADIFCIPYLKGVISMLVALISGFGIKWFPCAMMGYYLLITTNISEFVAAMERMHVTQKFTIPMSVMFRFFPTILEESRAISDAMRMRGVGFKSFPSNPTAMLEYRLVPLLMSIVKIGNELSAAALTRGLGSPIKRTNICKIGFGLLDILFIVVVTAIFIVYIIF